MDFVAPLRFQKDGLMLRCYRPGDGPALYRATAESREHLLPWLPWADQEQSEARSENLCRSFMAKYLMNEDYIIGLWREDDFVGGTGFHLRFGGRTNLTAEIGMWIHARESGKGLGTKALALMLEWGFTEWGWERLVWKCDTRNVGSARVAEKNGMLREGTLRSDAVDHFGKRRDTHLYALLKEEWQPLP